MSVRKHKSKSGKGAPSQRQLRVGEELRHALSEVFMRGETGDPEIDAARLTVAEVRVSPDLKNATVFMLPLGGEGKEEIIALVQEYDSMLRKLLSAKIRLKYTPRLTFRLDSTFDEASKIDKLLRHPKVQHDLTDKE